MKKTLYLLFFIAHVSLAFSQNGVGVGIFIQDTAAPIINLIRPLNNSGNPHGNLTLSYNASDASNITSCLLTVNDRLNATSSPIVKDTYLTFNLTNLGIGKNNWSINCTDANGFNGSSGTRLFSITRASKYNGSTTNLSNVDISSISNLVLEILPYGKMSFSSATDLSRGYDFDSFADIWANRIGLIPENITVLNKTASLTLYGLSLSNPRVLRDNSVCPSSICTISSYSGGTLNFQVNGFSNYSAQESPQEQQEITPGAGSGGGGGGGGGGSLAGQVDSEEDFEIDKNTLKIILKQGQTKREKITIKNTGDIVLDISANLAQLDRFRTQPESQEMYFTLNPGEEYTLDLTLRATDKDPADLYPAKIIFQSKNKKKELITLIEVESADPLFDVDVEILPQSKKTLAGKEVLFELNLFNVRSVGRVDVFVDYVIKDLEGNTVALEQETLAVETQARFTRSVLVPSDIQPGTYVAFVRITYGDATALSSDLFEVIAKEIKLYPIRLAASKSFLVGLGGILVAGILVFFLVQRKSIPSQPMQEKLMEEQKTQKLQKELKAIEDAFKAGFISKESYSSEKKRLEEKLGKADQPK